MDMTGEHRINAPRAVVWAGLNDPETLKQSIDGIEEITKASDTQFDAVAVVKVGPVKAKFKGKITLSEIDPPNGYTITGEGQGGAAGFAKGGAKVKLEDDNGGTLLKYTVNAQIGGKLAQIGSRLVDGAARKYADEFFTAFGAVVEARAAGTAPAEIPTPIAPESPVELAAGAEPAMAPAAVPPSASDHAGGKGLPPAAWIGGLIVVVGGALWWFLRR
ncbi:MAG TPA: carbon monoxide dehydrogenase subunit G [Dongiaceae bacterium]|nr:carbon monoxide dehydrogenase subunit G [Dongiaceae bacterium]